MAAALSISTETIRVAIASSVPSEIATIINSIITGDGINFNIIVFYFSAFLLASNLILTEFPVIFPSVSNTEVDTSNRNICFLYRKIHKI